MHRAYFPVSRLIYSLEKEQRVKCGITVFEKWTGSGKILIRLCRRFSNAINRDK
jgi:hypothetical protein